MGASPGHQRACRARPEAARQRGRRRQRRQSEAGQRERMAQDRHGAERADQRPDDEPPIPGQRPHPALVQAGILEVLERLSRAADVAVGQGHRSIVEWMGELDGWLDPLQPVPAEVQLGEQRRGAAERVDGAAHVVDHAGQRQLGGSASAAERVAGLVQAHRSAGAGQHDRRRQAVGAAAHHHRIGRRVHHAANGSRRGAEASDSARSGSRQPLGTGSGVC
jgi:hypothetical protein